MDMQALIPLVMVSSLTRRRRGQRASVARIAGAAVSGAGALACGAGAILAGVLAPDKVSGTTVDVANFNDLRKAYLASSLTTGIGGAVSGIGAAISAFGR